VVPEAGDDRGAAGVGTKSWGTADLNITNSEGELAGLPATATLDGYIQLPLKNR